MYIIGINTSKEMIKYCSFDMQGGQLYAFKHGSHKG